MVDLLEVDQANPWWFGSTTILTALTVSACFAVIFRVPRRYFLPTVLVGFVASLGKVILPTEWHISFATWMIALVVGSLSNGFARVTGMPAQGFLIPGVIILVPGALIYRSFSAALSNDTVEAGRLFLEALSTAFGISFGLLIANWIVPSKKTL